MQIDKVLHLVAGLFITLFVAFFSSPEFGVFCALLAEGIKIYFYDMRRGAPIDIDEKMLDFVAQFCGATVGYVWLIKTTLLS